MFKNVELSENESKVIRKIAKYQLGSLKKILRNEVEDVDIDIWTITNEINRDDLMDEISDKMDLFRSVIQEPKIVFSDFDEDDTSIFLHILHNEISSFPRSRKKIARKFDLKENISKNLN